MRPAPRYLLVRGSILLIISFFIFGSTPHNLLLRLPELLVIIIGYYMLYRKAKTLLLRVKKVGYNAV